MKPPKFMPTPDAVARVMQFVLKGKSLRTCSDAIGVNYKTLLYWVDRGRVLLDEHEENVDAIPTEYGKRCAMLVRGIKISRATYEYQRDNPGSLENEIQRRFDAMEMPAEDVNNPQQTMADFLRGFADTIDGGNNDENA